MSPPAQRPDEDRATDDALPYLPPWLDKPLLELLSRRDSLHHALLIHGLAGIGKQAFAWHVAAALLCEGQAANVPPGRACGQCDACHWFSQRNHPDFRAVLPEALDPDFVPAKGRKPSQEIRIDQIRGLSRFQSVGAHRKGWRIILIDPAHAMNRVTANGLLKMLEEPGQQTLLMLVTDRATRLGATVRSRCRSVALSGPDHEQAMQWLAGHGASDPAVAAAALAAAGSPMHALRLVEPAQATAHQAILEAVAALPDTSELRAVDALDSHDPHQWADVLQRWVSDLTRVQAGAAPHYFPASAKRLTSLAARTGLDQLTSLQVQLGTLTARIEHPLNPRLICESTLLAYCQVFDQSGSTR